MLNSIKNNININKSQSGAGFTLIELLVVISIIGLLASIVFVSLNNSRGKAANAAVASQLVQMRTQAEVLLSDTGSYDTLCDSGTASGSQFQAAAKNGNQGSGILGFCISSGISSGRLENGVITLGPSCCKVVTPGQWAVSIGLKDGSGYYCVDYQGIGGVQASRGIDTGPLDMTCN